MVSKAFLKSMKTPMVYSLLSISVEISSINSRITSKVDLFELKPYWDLDSKYIFF